MFVHGILPWLGLVKVWVLNKTAKRYGLFERYSFLLVPFSWEQGLLQQVGSLKLIGLAVAEDIVPYSK